MPNRREKRFESETGSDLLLGVASGTWCDCDIFLEAGPGKTGRVLNHLGKQVGVCWHGDKARKGPIWW